MNFPASCNKFCLIGKYLFTCLQGLHRGNGWAINCSKAPCTGKAFFPVYYQGHKRSAIKHKFQGMHTALLKTVFTKIFLVQKGRYGGEIYIQKLNMNM